MLFQKRQDFYPTQTVTLGNSLRQEITREFHIDAIYIDVKAVGSGNIATSGGDGLLGLLKRVQVQIADGAQTRNVVDVSGAALLEYAWQVNGGLDRDTMAAKGVTSISGNTYHITYPVFFALPQLNDPVRSALLLPAPRFNSNPVVTMQFAAQADIDSNNSPTAAFSSITARVIVIRRQVNIVDWPTFNTELAELSVSYPTTGNSQLYELQIPGSYTALALRAYTDANTRGDVMVSGGEFKLQVLGTVIRRFQLADIQRENDYSCFNADTAAGAAAGRFNGLYFLDFLTDATGNSVDELGSVLDANVVAGSGARVQLLQDITGGASVAIKYLSHRIFGNLADMKLGKKAGA